jgi:hypothetical protein
VNRWSKTAMESVGSTAGTSSFSELMRAGADFLFTLLWLLRTPLVAFGRGRLRLGNLRCCLATSALNLAGLDFRNY